MSVAPVIEATAVRTSEPIRAVRWASLMPSLCNGGKRRNFLNMRDDKINAFNLKMKYLIEEIDLKTPRDY